MPSKAVLMPVTGKSGELFAKELENAPKHDFEKFSKEVDEEFERWLKEQDFYEPVMRALEEKRRKNNG